MEEILKKNIQTKLNEMGVSLADFSRTSDVPYRTLQDIMALKRATKITTLASIAAGLGVKPGKLLEDKDFVQIRTEKLATSDADALAAAARAIEIASGLGPDIVARLGRVLASGDDNKAESIRSFLKAHLTGLESEGEPENQTLHADNQQTKPREKSPKRK